jgi:hypothetical protein
MNRVGDTLLHFGPNEQLLRALIDNGVDFVVVGGLAVSWYCSTRQADDMDLLVNPTSQNSARISEVLARLHLHCHDSASFSRPGLRVPLKQTYYAEILTPPKEGPSFDDVASDAADAKLFNIPVRLASVRSLIQMKQRAAAAAESQRDKHLGDIECLKQHAV